MYSEEMNAKMAAKQAQQYTNQACGAAPGTASLKDCEPKRAGLRDRLRDMEYRAQREERKGRQAAELGFLLDKNPDFARILDLLEEVGR